MPFIPLCPPPSQAPAHPVICHVSRRRSPCCFHTLSPFFLPHSKFVLLFALITYHGFGARCLGAENILFS